MDNQFADPLTSVFVPVFKERFEKLNPVGFWVLLHFECYFGFVVCFFGQAADKYRAGK